jgi:hypothetical protein
VARWSKTNPSPTAFRPGVSGNPAGRKPLIDDIHALARQHAPEAIQALVDALKDPDRAIPAAIALLDRGYGRPAVAVFAAVNVAVGGIDSPPRPPDIESAEEWLKRRRAELAMLDGPPPVSAEPAPHANNEPPPAQHQPRVEVREVVRPAEDR